MSDLVQAFNFVVRLTRTPSLPAALQPPPALGTPGDGSATAPAAPPGRRPAPALSAAGTPAAPGTGGQTLGDGGFAECTGLEIEAELHDVPEGGRNDGVPRALGRAKPATVVLKRGMLVESDPQASVLWTWLQDMVSGVLPVPRYNGTVEVLSAVQGPPDTDRTVVARWSFVNGLPAKVVGPALNAQTGTIALEELHIAHEGLRLERRRS